MMHTYTDRPDPSREAPATLWAWAGHLDRLGRELATGQREPTMSGTGELHTPADHHRLADTWRHNALYGALRLTGIPAMPEGPVLAPHTLSLGVEAGRFRVRDALGAAAADRQLPARLPDAVTALLTALDEAAGACHFTPKARGTYAMRTEQPCTTCPAWITAHRRGTP
ncbi:hypothetical protein ACIOG4_37590 [Streptomyces microflavus]|uniref:hypothetical protein n=1 Tax=Streptomyces microflavus TaxID=1919 RepID=UPI00381D1CE4